MAFYSKIWFENLIPDYLRARIKSEPGPYIIRSSTSNYQRQPRVLVLLDGKYQITDVMSVQVTRSRTVSSNTATITLLNIDTRYSAANQEKIKANVPVSIFFGFEVEYLQHFEGFIDTTSMTTDSEGSIITINCRDRAKMFLERTISAGIYSHTHEYLGYHDWHYRPVFKPDDNGNMQLVKYPRAWSAEEIIVDICYVMGLSDLKEYVYVTENALLNGTFEYVRHVRFAAEFDITIEGRMNTTLVTNFVEQNPLDCLGKVCQSILHEVLFDTNGKLVIRPIKKQSDPATFYMKEERDISSITEDINDDNVINVVTVIGQTANEQAIIYPFAPVAVKEQASLDKGQDLYGYTVDYPKVVSKVSLASLHNINIYAPVIHPDGQTFHNPNTNPENNPQFDTKIHFPNFSQGYDKQEVMSSSCPIVTDTADWAPVGNKRLNYFFGAVEEAIQFEFQPIILKDRFGKPVRVVCKERSMDSRIPPWPGIVNVPGIPGGAIAYCGQAKGLHQFDSGRGDTVDEDDVQELVPEEVYVMHGWVLGTGELNVTINGSVNTNDFKDGNAPITPPGGPIYNGVPLPTVSDSYYIVGWKEESNQLPPHAPLPPGISHSDVSKIFGVDWMTVARTSIGTTVNHWVKDTFANHKYIRNMVFYQFTKKITINRYVPTPGSLSGYVDVYISDIEDFKDADSVVVYPNFLANFTSLCSNCTVEQEDPSNAWSRYIIKLTYAKETPAGYALHSQYQVDIKYPVVIYTTSPTSFGTAGNWHYVLWDKTLRDTWNNIDLSKNKQLRAAGGRVPIWMSRGINDPDINCIFWTWFGGYSRDNVGSRFNTDGVGGTPGSGSQYHDDSGLPVVDVEKRIPTSGLGYSMTAGDSYTATNPHPTRNGTLVITPTAGPVQNINVPPGEHEITIPVTGRVVFYYWQETPIEPPNPRIDDPDTDDATYIGQFPPPENVKYGDGRDWSSPIGQPRRLIHRDEFYMWAADPNVVVIEILTDGVDGHSWAELIQLNENFIQCHGHNQYGNMEEEFAKMMNELRKMFRIIGIMLIILSIALLIEALSPRPVVSPSDGVAIMGPGAGAAGSAVGIIAPILGIILGIMLLNLNFGKGIGRNISKVMENMTVRVTAKRREEIHLYQNSSQAACWWVTNEMNHLTGKWHQRLGTHKHWIRAIDDPLIDGTGLCWVYCMDLTKPGHAGMAFPDGCYLTNFGWETPEVGDRNLIEYYEHIHQRIERTYRFKIEAFGDDSIQGYSAEYLLEKRFSLQVETDDWRDSYGYEVMVDQSMDDMGASDTGFWWSFFERREDYHPRRYKYLTLTVYSAKEIKYNNRDLGARVETIEYVLPGVDPENAIGVIFADSEVGIPPINPPQPPQPPVWGLRPVQVVFVMDASGSMATPILNVVAQIPAFMSALIAAGATSVQIGMMFQRGGAASPATTLFVNFPASGGRFTSVSSDLVFGGNQGIGFIQSGNFDPFGSIKMATNTYSFNTADFNETWYSRNIVLVTDTYPEVNDAAARADLLAGITSGDKYRYTVMGYSTHYSHYEPLITASNGSFFNLSTEWGSDLAEFFIDEYTAGGGGGTPGVVYPPIYSMDGHSRWGIFVARGLNPSWYSKYRWIEDRTEQNYLRFKVLNAGQQRLIAHVYNNTRYTSMNVDIRIWGKAYGTWAPTIVYYHEVDMLSMNSYGARTLRLENECINDYHRAKYIAQKLAGGATVQYRMTTTGKPQLKEGDIIMVKEETTGAIAGTFRIWENTFLDPEQKDCTLPANQLVVDKINGAYEPRFAIPSEANNVLIGCGSPTRPLYLLEVDAASNPTWWAKLPYGHFTPAFAFRIDGGTDLATGLPPVTQKRIVVGIRESQTVHILDYAVAMSIETLQVNGTILCGCTDEEQRFLWIGTNNGIVCRDLLKGGEQAYIVNLGRAVYGIAAVNHKVWDKEQQKHTYQNCGAVMCVTNAGIEVYRNWNDNYTYIGGQLGLYTQAGSIDLDTEFQIPFTNPGQITFTKSLGEIVYVHKATSYTNSGMIMGIGIEFMFDVETPEAGFGISFEEELLWLVDYYNDAEIMQQVPDSVSRIEYINRFFQPVFAVRDVNKHLIVTDTAHNRVYKINPSGKFYITELQTTFDVQQSGTSYLHQITAIMLENAMATMLTNFGSNFITEKTEEQIEEYTAMGIGRIIQVLPKEKYKVKLLTSETVVIAYNNAGNLDLRVNDTVVISYGWAGNRNMCAILGKKALHDWMVETGDPYVYVDATTVDATKYGQTLGSGATTTNVDLSGVNARLAAIEANIRALKGLHGIN